VDSNANPDGVDYLVPGNDDAMRAITFYCELAQAAVLDGLQTEMIKSGGDAGAAAEAPVEPAIAGLVSKDAAAPVEETVADTAPVEAEEAPTEEVAVDAK